ncbi:fibronectin type III domain-containing protein, partial [Paenimyroides tangerinum]
MSTWRGPFTFMTQKVTTSPWFEGFASATADGWNNISSSVFNLSNSISALMPMTDYVIYKNLYTADGNGSGITSLNVGPILTGDKLAFNYKMAMFSNPYGPVDASTGSVDVFISTDYGLNYTLLTNLPYNEVDGWQDFETPLNSYIGQIVKIKIVANYNYDPDDYVDHYIGFDNFYIGSCPLPSTPIVTNVSTNTAVINWEASATDLFEIEYGLAGFTSGTGTIVSATGNSITLNNLVLASNYEYFIRRVCGTNNSPWLGKFKFSTTCEVFTTGFTENFDSTDSTNPTVSVCWSFLDGGVGYGTVIDWNSSSTPNSYYMYNDSDITNAYILVSPETLNLNDGTYRVRFKARSGSNGYKLKFGTMSNKLDAATFTQLQEFSLTGDYQEFVVYLPVGTNDFFAFKHGQAGAYQSIYIDDVVYEPNPTCVEPVLLGASIDLVGLTADLTWSGPEVVTNNNFEIEWGEAGFVQGTGTIAESTSYSTSITNLVAEEGYSFYVRRICTGENTAWVGPYTFEMGYCIPVQPEFYSVDNLGVTNITIDNLNVNPTPIMYTSYLNEILTLNSDELISSSMTFNTDSGFSSYTYDTHIWIDLNNNGVFENNTEKVFTGVALAESPTTLNTSFIIPNTGNNLTGEYRIRIATADSAQSTPSPCYAGSYSHIFDFKATVTFPCNQPSNINFVDVGFDYATLDWQGQGNTNFEIEYGLTGFTQGSGTVIQNATKPYTINNLTPGSTYDFYIRKKCGNIFSDWSTVATTYVFCDTPEPTGANSQTLIQYELLSDLAIVGQNLKFYTDPGLTQEVPVSTVLNVSGTYFVTQTINCESDAYLIVDVTVTPRIAQPIVDSNQNFCNGGTLADIPVTLLPGATVIWYADETSATILPETTVVTNNTYYVAQTDGVTTSIRVQVNVTVNPTPVDLVSQPIHLCGAATFGNLVINNLPGTTVKWYVSPTAITPIDGNVPVSTGTYYVTQAFGICESQRVAFQISQYDALERPLASTQIFCGSGTVAELVADGVNGAQILWYASSTAVTTLSPAAVLSTGTYYVAQTINGCTSDRRAVAVRVISTTAPQVSPINLNSIINTKLTDWNLDVQI